MTNRAALCPRCRKIIGSNENVCSWCGTSRSNPWWKLMAWSRGSMGEDWLVQTVVMVNAGLFILSILLTRHLSLTLNPLSLLAPGDSALLLLGATGTVPIDRFGNLWSLISANYLHGGILHIVFNLMAFRQIAPWVIQEYGDARMFIIYTVGGIGGYILSYLAGIPFTIGASAAICALIGALLYYGKSRGGAYGAMVYREVSGWVVGLILFGLIFPGINNWAHGGGIISGILLGMALGYRENRRESPLYRYLAVACGVATVACLAWGVVIALLFNFIR